MTSEEVTKTKTSLELTKGRLIEFNNIKAQLQSQTARRWSNAETLHLMLHLMKMSLYDGSFTKAFVDIDECVE